MKKMLLYRKKSNDTNTPKAIIGRDEPTDDNSKSICDNRCTIRQTCYGIRFPWEAILAAIVGLASEIVDAMFMSATLEALGTDLDPSTATIISYIVGAGCFFSMAFAGFQLGNLKYHTKLGEWVSYIFWATAGLALVSAKLISGMVQSGELSSVIAGEEQFSAILASEEFISNAIIAFVQMVLYIGTGFMTRDSIRILTDNDLREFMSARKEYANLLDKLSTIRGEITKDISILKSYPKYAKRLIRSKDSVKNNVAQYNEAARAIVEARMALRVDPDIMEDIYDNAMKKEGRSNK